MPNMIEENRKELYELYEDYKNDIDRTLEIAVNWGDCKKVRSIIKSGQFDLRNEHKVDHREPLLFILLKSREYSLSQRKSIIRLMVEHGADIHIEDGENVLTASWWASRATTEFLLTEYSFSNKEMLKALECTYYLGYGHFIELKDLQLLLKYGLKLNAKITKKLLFEAVDRYDAEMTEFLLDNCNISANCVNDCGLTPLHKASDDSGEGAWHEPRSKYRKVAKILLDHGADVNSKVKNSDVTPLMLASDIDVFKFLLKHGADIHAVTRTRQKDMLMKQAGNRCLPLPIVKLLVEKYHFDVRKKDKKGVPVLSFALEVKNLEVAAYLLEKGAATVIADVDSYVRKFRNSENQQYSKLLKCLIKHGMGVNSQGKNVLFYAADFFDLSRLLQMGADASIVANDGTTLLMNSELDYNAFTLLAEHGADPDKTPGGVQGLFTWWLNQEVSWWGHDDILSYLIEKYSLDPDTRDKDGRTTLFYGSESQLLALGADPDITDNYGNTPLIFCFTKCWRPGVIPEEFFHNPNHQNNEGKTALHYAVKSQKRTMIQNLLDHGVDCGIKDNSGKTALDYAREWNRTNLYDLLENDGNMKQHN
jgi:ankyrin repeat protein, putative